MSFQSCRHRRKNQKTHKPGAAAVFSCAGPADDLPVTNSAYPNALMKNTRLILLVLLLFTAPAAVHAQDLQDYDFVTNADDATITITAYTGSGGDVAIPAAINGLPVTGIGEEAFFKSSVTNVTIGSNVTSIGNSAFFGATTLAAITIPASVTNIGPFAFCGCSNLGVVIINSSSAGIDAAAFFGCTSLTNLIIEDGVTSIGDSAFYGCSSLAGVEIPASVTNIGNMAFAQCASLTNVDISYGVPNIGDSTFEGCASLPSLSIPGSVTNIGNGAFGGCASLTNVLFEGDAPSAGSSVFSSDNVTLYYYLGTAGWSSTFAGLPIAEENPYSYITNNGAILITQYNGGIGNVTVPDSINGLPVTVIGSYAFAGAGIINLRMPESITTIGEASFFYCSSLTSVTIPGSVASIGARAFEYCGLTNATIGNGVSSIGDSAFYGCANLPCIEIPASVTNIGTEAFAYCGSLRMISVDTDNPSFFSVDGVLFDNNQAALLAFPGGLTGGYTVPAGVSAIADEAFEGCAGLTSVTIPASVSSIGNLAFYDSTSISSVYFLGNAPIVNSDIFECDCHTKVYYLPGTAGWSNILPGLPKVLWNPCIQTGNTDFGVQNGQFGFSITCANTISVVVEACASLASPVWTPLQTVTLTNGSFYFSEPVQANSPGRIYNLVMP
jgi:hypothetical protein